MIVNTQVDRRNGVTYQIDIEQDDLQVKGNAMASGDSSVDRRVEQEILKRLDDGDTWAWASVTVRASLGEFYGEDYLGGCSYRNTKDFIRGSYYADMKREALAQLKSRMLERTA